MHNYLIRLSSYVYVYYDIFQCHRSERAKCNPTQAQVSAINMDHTSDMAEDKKRWLCVPRREKKLQNTKQKMINVKVVMLLCFI